MKLTGPSFNFFQFGRSRCADDELWGKMLIFAETFCGDGIPAFDERYSSLSVGRALNRACGTASCRKHFSLMKKELEDQLATLRSSQKKHVQDLRKTLGDARKKARTAEANLKKTDIDARKLAKKLGKNESDLEMLVGV